MALLSGFCSAIMLPSMAFAQTTPAHCPAPQELLPQLEQQRSDLENTRDRLETFVSGKQLTEVSPTSLFIVEIGNEQAIQRRIQELLASQKEPLRALTEDLQNLVACADAQDDAHATGQQLVQIQTEINKLRLQFLTLPKDRRNALIAAYQTMATQSENVARLEQERAAARQQKEQAAKSIEAAEVRAKTAGSASLRELAVQRTLLEKTREDLADMHVRLTAELQDRTGLYQQTAQKLAVLTGQMTQNVPPQQLADSYAEAASIWRTLVDEIFERLAGYADREPIPQLPQYPQGLLDQLGKDPQVAQHQQAYRELQQQHQALTNLRQNRFDAERDNLYRLLLQAGQIRSQLLQLNIDQGNAHVLEFSDQYLSDLIREIRIVPYRFLAAVYAKLVEFRTKASGGVSGWANIAYQILLFAIVIAIPFILYRALSRLTDYLNRLRSNLIQRPTSSRRTRSMVVWLRRLNAYVSWVIMLLGVWLTQSVIAGTAFAELGIVLPYVAYYLWYRIFMLIFSSLLGNIAYVDGLQAVAAQSERIKRTVREVVIFFILALAILHATQDVAGKALIYLLVSNIMLYVGTLICAHAAWRWRNEIGIAATRTLPREMAEKITTYCSGRWSWIACLPSLIIVIAVVATRRLKKQASQYDFFKRIAAEIFRRRVESAESGTVTSEKTLDVLPNEYLRWFDTEIPKDVELAITPSSGVTEKVTATIKTWLAERHSEHSLVLYGDRGCGKSTLLNRIQNSFPDIKVRYITVPPKMYTREAVLRFFAEQLNINLDPHATTPFTIEAVVDPTLILIDDTHNLFLARLGGFEGYRAFMELVNAPANNLFWCAAFNRRSWSYLRGVFGGNQFFRKIIEIPPMSDVDVQNLIMTRHHQTTHQLAYDEIIQATQIEEEGDDATSISTVERQFFRLLWGQASGNPHVAIKLWLTALTPLPDGRLKVSIPQQKSLKGMETAGDEAWFVYAALLRHVNLTAEEAAATTHLPQDVIIDAIKIGMENHAITKTGGDRYRITATAQYPLSRLLALKNFVYE